MSTSLFSLFSPDSNYRFSLDRTSKKHRCPQCERITFVRYVDNQTGDYLPEHYGRCDREANCTYFLNPYSDGFAKAIESDSQQHFVHHSPPKQEQKAGQPEPAFIPVEVLNSTLQGYEENVFLQNLLNRVPFPFDAADIEEVVSMYWLGTITEGFRRGAVCFPFIDICGRVRAIQVKQFDETNHTTGTGFLHAMLKSQFEATGATKPDWLAAYLNNEKKVSCLFGEHLLKQHPRNPVALVEAPKTAIYGTLYFGLPDNEESLLWLAVYNLSSLNLSRCKVLQGRRVLLFPDLSKTGHAFNDWSAKAKQMEAQLPKTQFIVSDLLETNASEEERAAGCDLADYLIKLDWKALRSPQPAPAKGEKSEKSDAPKKPFFLNKPATAETSSQQIAVQDSGTTSRDVSELAAFFETTTLPTGSFRLNACSTINDLPKFVEAHLNFLKQYGQSNAARQYFDRLKDIQALIASKTNSPVSLVWPLLLPILLHSFWFQAFPL